MRVDFFASGSPDCPILVIRNFVPDEVSELKSQIERLESGEVTELRFDELPFADSGVSLDLHVSKRSTGIRATPPNFHCYLSPVDWSGVAGLLEPFCVEGTTGFQWLAGDSDVSWLITSTGKW